MSDELDYRWRKVSEHGQPDEVTCPWGVRISGDPSTLMEVWEVEEAGGLLSHIAWQPLPPPRDEMMPPPEPEPRWVVDRGWIKPSGPGPIDEAEVEQACRDLNAIHEHGAVVRVRDWQEAPDDGTVLLRWAGEGWTRATGRYVRDRRSPWGAMPPGPGEVER